MKHGHAGQSGLIPVLVKLRIAKETLIWPTAQLTAKQIGIKNGQYCFLDVEIIIFIFFRIFNITIQQDKKRLAFFCRKYIK